MSFHLMAKVWDDETIDDGVSKFILLCLADYANNETFDCFPSLTSISKRTGFALATIKRHLDKLEDREYIVRVSGDSRRSNRYHLYPAVYKVGSERAYVGSERATNLSSNLDKPTKVITEDWKPKPETIEKINQKHGKGNIDHDNETNNFTLYYIGTAQQRKWKDWDKAYQNWCNKAVDFKQRGNITSLNQFKRNKISNRNGHSDGFFAGLAEQFKDDYENHHDE